LFRTIIRLFSYLFFSQLFTIRRSCILSPFSTLNFISIRRIICKWKMHFLSTWINGFKIDHWFLGCIYSFTSLVFLYILIFIFIFENTSWLWKLLFFLALSFPFYFNNSRNIWCYCIFNFTVDAYLRTIVLIFLNNFNKYLKKINHSVMKISRLRQFIFQKYN
jgi:hypothetical protein